MIKITFSDGSVCKYAKGTTAGQIAEDINLHLAKSVLAANVNGEIWDLSRPINENAVLKLYKWEDSEGKYVFWHSSAHLLAEALQELYPNTKFGIGPAVENGFYYDVDLGKDIIIKETDLTDIEKKMKELVEKKIPIQRKNISKTDALLLFEKTNEIYKTELIKELKENSITIYIQNSFIDLCRGPHLPNTSYIKAIKLTSISGSYWRGDRKRCQLTRIHGVTFPNEELLRKYFIFLKKAETCDHRRIGKEMGLFAFSQNVGQGLPLWLPKGTQLRLRLEEFLKKIQQKYNYQQVITPHIGNKSLYISSGHYAKYKESSFHPIHTPIKEEEFLLKPMNCPHHCEIYKAFPRSYKELPLRLAEFGTVYRYEQSGELHGLTRVRGFTQDDAHIFCTSDQVEEEFTKVMSIIQVIFHALNFTNYETQISLRDPNDKSKYIGSEKNWEQAENAIIEVCRVKKIKAQIELGEAAFYGPKLDFIIKDAMGRKWQLGTIQVDYNLPERFDMEYIGPDNKKHRPVIIHRAPFGSIERFVSLLIEHTSGKLPLWLIPDQAVVIPISKKFNEYAEKIVDLLKKKEIRVFIDERNEKIGRKIRDHELKKIPYLLIVGNQEMKNSEVSVRKQGEGNIGLMKITTFADYLNEQIEKQTSSIG